MFVRDRMSSPAVTITSDTSYQDALKLMHERRFRRLPVVDSAQKLIGIVAERDLLHAAPSPATSLSMWELNYLLSRLKVSELMATKVITVDPDMPIEQAAHLMVEHRIGGLPVVDAQRHVLGLITETDIFRAFVEMLGTSRPGLRLMLRVPGAKGTLAKLATAIAEMGGNIVSVGTFDVDLDGTAYLLVKVVGVEQSELVNKLEALGDHVLDVRTV